MTIPTIQQRARLLVHAGWDMRDDGLSNEKMIEQLQTEGVPEHIATGVPALVDEAQQGSVHDDETRQKLVTNVAAAIDAEDFDAVQNSLKEMIDDDRTLHKAYSTFSELLVGDSHEKGTVAAYGLSLLVGMGDWPLIQALDHENENVRYRAAFALGKMGSAAKNALPALKKLKSDPDDYVHDAVSQAIGRIKPWWKFW